MGVVEVDTSVTKHRTDLLMVGAWYYDAPNGACPQSSFCHPELDPYWGDDDYNGLYTDLPPGATSFPAMIKVYPTAKNQTVVIGVFVPSPDVANFTFTVVIARRLTACLQQLDFDHMVTLPEDGPFPIRIKGNNTHVAPSGAQSAIASQMCGADTSHIVAYRFLPKQDGHFYISTAWPGTSFDTVVAIAKEPSACTQILACNDDSAARTAFGVVPSSSVLKTRLYAGARVIIYVGGSTPRDMGNFELTLDDLSLSCPVEDSPLKPVPRLAGGPQMWTATSDPDTTANLPTMLELRCPPSPEFLNASSREYEYEKVEYEKSHEFQATHVFVPPASGMYYAWVMSDVVEVSIVAVDDACQAPLPGCEQVPTIPPREVFPVKAEYEQYEYEHVVWDKTVVRQMTMGVRVNATAGEEIKFVVTTGGAGKTYGAYGVVVWSNATSSESSDPMGQAACLGGTWRAAPGQTSDCVFPFTFVGRGGESTTYTGCVASSVRAPVQVSSSGGNPFTWCSTVATYDVRKPGAEKRWVKCVC